MIGDTTGPTNPRFQKPRAIRPNRNRPIEATGGVPNTFSGTPMPPIRPPQSTIDLPPLAFPRGNPNPPISTPPNQTPPWGVVSPPGNQTPPWGIVNPTHPQSTIDLPPLGSNPGGNRTPPWGVVSPPTPPSGLPADVNVRRAAAGLPPIKGYPPVPATGGGIPNFGVPTESEDDIRRRLGSLNDNAGRY